MTVVTFFFPPKSYKLSICSVTYFFFFWGGAGCFPVIYFLAWFTSSLCVISVSESPEI